MIGQLLDSRYQVTAVLAAGGFGQTYKAADTRRPGSPTCVVKQLKPQRTDPAALEIARRLFGTEAETLEHLGQHPQIPRLLAYFEDQGQFYLVQEFIDGHPLSAELPPKTPAWSEAQITQLLKELLPLLEFVHSQEVIHRDIKPDNLIRRRSDGQLVMIDFGTVKQVRTQLAPNSHGSFTVAVGTPGYMPGEQSMGKPRYSSDLYAMGMMAIQALTGVTPDQLQSHPITGEIIWRDQVRLVSSGFADWLDQMVRYDFRQRFLSAEAALRALNSLTSPAQPTLRPSAQPTVAVGSPPLPTSPASGLSKVQIARQKPAIAAALQPASPPPVSKPVAPQPAAVPKPITPQPATVSGRSPGLSKVQMARQKPAIAAALQPTAPPPVSKPVAPQPAAVPKPVTPQPATVSGLSKVQMARQKPAIATIASVPNTSAINSTPAARNKRRGLGWFIGMGCAGFLGLVVLSIGLLYFYVAWRDYIGDPVPVGTPPAGGRRTENSSGNTTTNRSTTTDSGSSSAIDSDLEQVATLMNQGQFAEAEALARQVIERDPNNALAYNELGVSVGSQGRTDESEQHYRRAIELDPSFARAYENLGFNLINKERFAEAESTSRRAAELEPNNVTALNNLGAALEGQQRFDEAVSAYRQAVALEPDDPMPYSNLASVLLYQGRYAEAEPHIRSAISRDPQDALNHNILGVVLEGLGRNREAQAAYTRAEQLSNSN
jgi:serine/threonine protein kinase/Flp pilus assembly protein TadD